MASRGRKIMKNLGGSSSSKSKKKASPKRHVFFVEERNTVQEFEAVDSEDVELLESLWQQGWEMHNGKQDIKVRAKQWRQTGMGLFLNNAYHCDNDLSPTLCQKQLNTLAQLPDEMHMRGVERYLSRKHDQERTSRKRSIIREVVQQYRTLQTQVNCKALDQGESQQLLGQFARRLNQDAETFARRIAKADELVARKGPAKSIRPAQELLEYLHSLELEKMRGASSHNKRGPLNKAATQPQPHASAALSGRRLQARQA